MTNRKRLDDHLRVEKQDRINDRYAQLAEETQTWFNCNSTAYRFTNESLGDLLKANMNLEGHILTITASGDIICLLAGMRPKEAENFKIDSIDISKYANAWGEWKWQAFLNQDLKTFKRTLVRHEATWKDFPFDLKVSRDARALFEPKKGRSEKLIETTDIFQSQGYACSEPNSTGFIDKSRFEKIQKRAQGVDVEFYRSDFTTFFNAENVPEQHYSTIYISNILDHIIKPGTKPEERQLDLSEKRIDPLVNLLNKYLRKDGTIIINFQWSERAKQSSEKALDKFGLKLKTLKKNYWGCGFMYIASR